MKKKAEPRTAEIEILEIQTGVLEACIMGTTPLILNRLSEKTRRTLLLPPPKKTAADKAQTLKHDVLAEYRASPHRNYDPKGESHIQADSSSFKNAMASAALDIPGAAKKAQIARLAWVVGERVSIYGVPKLLTSNVRNSDINRTPDIRIRAILPEWCCRIRVSYMKPALSQKGIGNLLSAAGMIRGVGDWRAEKGNGRYGCFELCSPSDVAFKRIMKAGNYKVQAAAMEEPTYYDSDSQSLVEWYFQELERRGHADRTEQIAKKTIRKAA